VVLGHLVWAFHRAGSGCGPPTLQKKGSANFALRLSERPF
jgi:hypothetical protein